MPYISGWAGRGGVAGSVDVDARPPQPHAGFELRGDVNGVGNGNAALDVAFLQRSGPQGQARQVDGPYGRFDVDGVLRNALRAGKIKLLGLPLHQCHQFVVPRAGFEPVLEGGTRVQLVGRRAQLAVVTIEQRGIFDIPKPNECFVTLDACALRPCPHPGVRVKFQSNAARS